MKYMLDTNIIIYIIKHRPEAVFRRFQELAPSDFCISAVTMAEMEYGISKSSRPEQNRIAFDLPFDDAAAEEYGPIRAGLEKDGMPIGPNDLLIAAHAKSRDLILVTNNTREFDRVEGLTVENWV